jgi:hypothetical protein
VYIRQYAIFNSSVNLQLGGWNLEGLKCREITHKKLNDNIQVDETNPNNLNDAIWFVLNWTVSHTRNL